MLPEWVTKILGDMGFPGVVIFMEFMVCAGLVAYIKSLQNKADKVYGYRLAERDTLNKTLSDTAGVLRDMLKVTEERNELTEEQAKLIAQQAHAFELLKVTILAQYENIKDHNDASAMAVTAMADAIRQLTTIVTENRTIAQGHVQDVRATMNAQGEELRKVLRECSDAQIKALREQGEQSLSAIRAALGNVRVVNRGKRRPKTV
jgi:hypothetical protein